MTWKQRPDWVRTASRIILFLTVCPSPLQAGHRVDLRWKPRAQRGLEDHSSSHSGAWQSPELLLSFSITSACEPDLPMRTPGQWPLSATSWFSVWVSSAWSKQTLHRNTTHSPMTTSPCGSEASSSPGFSSSWAFSSS